MTDDTTPDPAVLHELEELASSLHIIVSDEKGAPAFSSYLNAVYQAVPDAALATLPGESDDAKRWGAVIGHLVDGMAEMLFNCYGDPDLALTELAGHITQAVARQQNVSHEVH